MRKLFPAWLFLSFGVLFVAATYFDSVHFKGVILYNRTAPAPKPLAVSRNRLACGEMMPDETVLVHKKGGLQNVLIFIANIAPESLPPLALNLEMKACRFRPRVLALGVGSELTIRNQDPILHDVNARWQPFANGWNQTSTLDIFSETAETYFSFAFPKKGLAARQKLDKPGLVRLRSDTGHDWMSGFILVMPHRYFAVTDAEGKFELPELPSGRYDLVMWHETLGVKRQVADLKSEDKNNFIIKWFPEEPGNNTTADQAN
jgi:hypothetical protein